MHESARRVIEPFLDEVDRIFGATYAAILFGSAARGDFVPGRSDLNLMLILERADPAELVRLRPALERWGKGTPGLPLIISRDEWLHGVDVFPIEICDLKAAHRVLRGPDLVAPLQPDPHDLRRALEKEFRGKLLRLRQRYATTNDGLAEWAGTTISAIVLFLRCLLILTRHHAPVPPDGVIEEVAALLGFEPAPVLRVLACRTAPKPSLAATDFEAYIRAVELAASYTDQLELGDQPS